MGLRRERRKIKRMPSPPFPTPADFKKSYRNRFPFKLATTSFIYRDSYAPNVARLAPFFDEIELLFFESSDLDLPAAAEIEQLKALAHVHGITYNVHLPTDVCLSDPVEEHRELAIEAIGRVIEAVKSLSPASYTLHIRPPSGSFSSGQVERLRASTAKAVETISRRTEISPSILCVENLEDPFSFAESIIEDLGLGVCLDIGHLVHFRHDLEATVSRWLPRASVIHLHGASQGRDHQALSAMDTGFLKSLMGFFKECAGKTVCLEVFSLEALLPSLDVFEAAWEKIGAGQGVPAFWGLPDT